jgi:hypothetical protein
VEFFVGMMPLYEEPYGHLQGGFKAMYRVDEGGW